MLGYLHKENRWFSDGHDAMRANGETWGWSEGVDYLVIDGSVDSRKRQNRQEAFNDPENLRYVFLISVLKRNLVLDYCSSQPKLVHWVSILWLQIVLLYSMQVGIQLTINNLSIVYIVSVRQNLSISID